MMEYLTASTKVEQLNMELLSLSEQLAAPVGGSTWEAVTGYLAVGDPSMPVPVVPDRIRGRNAAMIGGVVGIGVAWVFVNRKWIANGMPADITTASGDDGEDEA